MIPHVYLSSAYSFTNDISDHYPIFISCNKNLSDGFNIPKKTFKWSKHTKNTNILSHNYFSVLSSNLESKFDEISADNIVKKFINISISVGKIIKAFIPSKFKGYAFHCPEYVKKISIAKHLAYENIKTVLILPFDECLFKSIYSVS